MTALLAYHGDPKIQAKYLRRVQAHAKADEIIKGRYWEGGKGCAVGCTIHGSTHVAYETELGIPEALARLEDTIFEGLTNSAAKEFPVRFLTAIKVGADLSRVQWQFLHWLLTEELTGRAHPLIAAAVRRCADVLVPPTKGQLVDRAKARSAWAWVEEVWAKAEAAWARAARVRAAAEAAWAAGEAAAEEALGSRAAVRAKVYKRMADKLIELLTEAK